MNDHVLLYIAVLEAVGGAAFLARSGRPFPKAPSPVVAQRAFRITGVFATVGGVLFALLWAQDTFRWFDGSPVLQLAAFGATVGALGLSAWVYLRALRSLRREVRDSAPSGEDAA